MNYWLEYRSRKLNITFTNGIRGFKPILYNGITFCQDYFISKSGTSNYYLILKKKVQTKEEISDAKSEIADMCGLINTYSTFVIGWPLTMDVTTPMGVKRYIRVAGNVDGWESNADELYTAFRKKVKKEEPIMGKVSIGKVDPWVEMERNPIPDLIEILKKREKANPLVREIAKYFYLAKLNDTNIRYLILGKALEIAKIIFRPSSPKRAFIGLPQEIKDEFGEKDIGWLYEMSNFRYETRHALDKKNNQGMHPELSDQECYEFTRLSNLILTYLVRKEFGLETIIWKRK